MSSSSEAGRQAWKGHQTPLLQQTGDSGGLHCQLLQISRTNRSRPCVWHPHLFPDHKCGEEPPGLEKACELGQAPGLERSSQCLPTRDGRCQAHVLHGTLGLWLEQVWWRAQGLLHPAQERKEVGDSTGSATTKGQSCVFCLARPCSPSLPWGSWAGEVTTVPPQVHASVVPCWDCMDVPSTPVGKSYLQLEAHTSDVCWPGSG